MKQLSVLGLMALLVAGCPNLAEAPISKTCTRLADKCKLDHGPLGVCISSTCGAGQTPPCYVCQPQH